MSPLFEEVQTQQIFNDNKTFVDCVPKGNPEEILNSFLHQRDNPGFNLKSFVLSHFGLPKPVAADFKTDKHQTTSQHIEALWPVLSRQPDKQEGSLIPLPHPYIVPGGRFGEVYYWDSYFTMLGLKESNRVDMMENMVDNFSYLIGTLGFIPNGNRTYYLGRSQPPFFSLMVQLLASIKGRDILTFFLPSLEKEYKYWMEGTASLSATNTSSLHTVRMPDGEILNIYRDKFDTPRPESYREDVMLSRESGQRPNILFNQLRSGAESGWDFSSRWFRDGKTLQTINTTNIVPVDLNCLLFNLERTIADGFKMTGNPDRYHIYNSLSEKRMLAIQKYCWNRQFGFFFDYDSLKGTQSGELTLAGMYPLYFKIADNGQATQCKEIIHSKFLKAGGVVTTLKHTGQQWDAPNGWAPLQWITITGLRNYGYQSLSDDIAKKWIALNDKIFYSTGKMMEKYNVENMELTAGGGEYPAQDGFGWSNGVYLALKKIILD